MGRPKKAATKHVEPEDISQELPEEEPAVVLDSAPIPKEAVSQSDAARAALDAGYEKPAEAVSYIKDTFGIEMNPQYFSAIKTRTRASQEAAPKKAAAPAPKAKRGRKPKVATPPVNGYVAPPEKPKPAGEPDVLLALENIKELVGQFGTEKLKRMVDLMG